MGLINRIVPRTILNTYVNDYAQTIARNAPLTIYAAKVVIDELIKSDGGDEARMARVVDDCFNSADYQEGRKAFMEKRKPHFKGK